MTRRVRLAAVQQCSAVLQGILHVALDSRDGVGVDQRALFCARFQTVAYLEVGNGGAEAFHKGIVNAALHQKTVGANAGLARVAEFRHHGRCNGDVDIGIIKDNKRRVAAQLQ